MIIVDAGPLVAFFNIKDKDHKHCIAILREIKEPLYTTIPVLTEAFHLLYPGSFAADSLNEFIVKGGIKIWFMDEVALVRACELMQKYEDHPMDFADASIIVALEQLQITKVFTLDHNDFTTYRIKKGHRNCNVEIIN
jgi:predicted nucleic acid-binding protein